MKKWMFGLAAAVALAPASIAANNTFTICAPGAAYPSFVACASATVSFAPTLSGGQITLDVTNTGLFENGSPSTTWGYAITGIGITAPNIENPSWGGIDVSNATAVGSDPAGEWSFTQFFDGFSVQAGAATGGVNGGIWGEYGSAGGKYLRTNPGQYVRFTFNTTASTWVDPSSVTVSFAMRGQSGYEGDSYRCSDDPKATNGNGGCDWGGGTPDTSTPEPMSLVLLGSGLLGIAGVHNRRRRRRQ